MKAKPFLKTLRLKNFKAVQDSGSVPFTPITVLIGNNGSGKSSLIEGLDTYRAIVMDGLDQAMGGCMRKSPDTVVAEKVIEQLRSQNLLSDATLKTLAEGLGKGDMRPEDWRVLVEKELARPKDESNAAKD